jgi:uncharacterized membrane protein YuzA (DUF378 family)
MQSFIRGICLIAVILWALPWTLLGLFFGILSLLTGGGAQRTGRVLEFWGGAARWLLRYAPFVAGAAAITFGHTVLARSRPEIEATREHELVHVRQYERYGPLFVPLYLLYSLCLWVKGKNPYYDNPFEREAYDEAP